MELQLYILRMRLKKGRISKFLLIINTNFLRLSPRVLYFLPVKKKERMVIQKRFM